MSRLPPLPPERLLPAMQELLGQVESAMGFLPNDALIMARKPQIAQALAQLVRAVQAPGELPERLRRLVALASSLRAGCGYCAGHTRFSALRGGIGQDLLDELERWRDSDAFSQAEKAALQVAERASQVPNAVTDQDFAQLRQHFSDDAVVELVALVALFGFLNRWNATLDTELEAACRI